MKNYKKRQAAARKSARMGYLVPVGTRFRTKGKSVIKRMKRANHTKGFYRQQRESK